MIIESLFTTQNEVRDPSKLAAMRAFCSAGGVFDDAALELFGGGKKIAVMLMEDGDLYVRDGHHRVVSILMAGRTHLLSEEFTLQRFSYDQLRNANVATGWVTPFDPKTQCRLPDMTRYRSILPTFAVNSLEDQIRQASLWYIEGRKLWTFGELAEQYGVKC